MDIQKEREEFEKLPAVAELIKTNDVLWSEVHGEYFGSDHELDCWIDGAWAVWQAKSQAVPEGFVLVPKESLKVALSWMDAKSQAVPEGFVSIEDVLPRDGQYVIAFDAIKHCVFKDGEFLQGYLESDTGHEYSEPVEVTHWMAIEAQEQSHDSKN